MVRVLTGVSVGRGVDVDEGFTSTGAGGGVEAGWHPASKPRIKRTGKIFPLVNFVIVLFP
jgi:hypothetical protein